MTRTSCPRDSRLSGAAVCEEYFTEHAAVLLKCWGPKRIWPDAGGCRRLSTACERWLGVGQVGSVWLLQPTRCRNKPTGRWRSGKPVRHLVL
jgi:hypothetical protein